MIWAYGSYLAWVFLFMGMIPPLNDDQIEVLRSLTTDDTGFVQEEPLDILIENVRGWDDPGGFDIDIEVLDYDLIFSEPGSYRGELMGISGSLLRIDDLSAGYSDMAAWIIQIRESKHVVIVLLPVTDAGRDIDGIKSVDIAARFYKRLRLKIADTDEFGGYLVFVGAFPQVVYRDKVDRLVFMVMVSIILTGMIVWLVLLRISKSKNKLVANLPGWRYFDKDNGYENLLDGDLPEDQIAALSELRNRAEKLSN